MDNKQPLPPNLSGHMNLEEMSAKEQKQMMRLAVSGLLAAPATPALAATGILALAESWRGKEFITDEEMSQAQRIIGAALGTTGLGIAAKEAINNFSNSLQASNAATKATNAAKIENNVYAEGGEPAMTKKMFDAAAHASTRNAGSTEVVLGSYVKGSANSYEQVAKSRGATYFEVPDWSNVQGQLGANQMWNVNKSFLDQQISQGKSFVFTVNPKTVNPDAYTAREARYLQESGYKIIESAKGEYRAVKK